MGDRIVISGVQVYAYGGVSEAERAIGQRYQMDIQLGLDLAPGGSSDDLRDTVSYAEAHDVAVTALRDSPFHLVEHAADRVAAALLASLPVDEVTVRLMKLLPPIDGIVGSAGVEIHRQRDEMRSQESGLA
jgi:dihydroneopterin aldolase